MIGRFAFFAVIVCGFAAIVAMPSSPDEGTGSETNSNSSNSVLPSANAAWFAGDHTLTREADGHFYAAAHIDGAPVRMMVDTGASVIALTANDAYAAGLHWDDSEVSHIGQGASGPVYGVQTRLREVEIGGMTRNNVQAVIVPEGLHISLLGQSYLRQIGAVEISGDQMVMSAE